MRGRCCHRPTFLMACVLTLAFSSAAAQDFVQYADQTNSKAQGSVGDFRAENNQSSRARSQAYGIMGQVARPGVYELNERSVTLRQLVDYAGGLTKNAQGRVRLIRGGRAGQQTWYTPQSRFELFAGDLVIVDAVSNAGAMANGVDGQFVQLGFVNLLSNPVVIKLRREYATARGIVLFLGQSAQMAGSVQIVSSTRFNDLRGTSNQPGRSLPSGTVLIFDPRTIDYSRLPSLPVPYTSDALQAERRNRLRAPNPIASMPQVGNHAPKPIGPLAEREIDPPAVPGRVHIVTPSAPATNPKTPSSDESKETETTEPSESAGNVEPPKETTTEPISPSAPLPDSEPDISTPAAQNGAIAAAENHPVSEIKDDMGFAFVDLNSAAEPVPAEAQRAHNENHVAQTSPVSNDTTSNAPPRLTQRLERAKEFTDWPAVSILIIVISALVIATVVLWPLVKRDPPRPPRQTSPREYLDAIISDKLPILEERIELPETQEFYGSPSIRRQLRVDAKEDVPKPNFRPNVTSKQPVLAAQFVGQAPPASDMAGTSQKFGREPIQSSTTQTATEVPQSDIIERALRTVQGDQQG